MNKFFSFVLAFLICFTNLGVRPTYATGNIIYVNDDAPGPTFDGTSWTTAYKKLQNALDNAISGDQVWVATGVYYPDEGTTHTNNERSESFNLISGVAIYGGFNGTETMFSQRNPNTNIAILSGDLQQDDTNTDGNFIAETTSDIQGDNAYNVVENISPVVDGTAILDGFVITAGKADGDPLTTTTSGGALKFLSGNSPTLANLTISGNYASANGGGIFLKEGSNPNLSHVLFIGNHANNGGAAYIEESDPIFNAITINGNTADNGGGITITVDSSPTLTGILIHNNSADMTGGGMVINNSTPLLEDVTFSYNDAQGGGGVYIGTKSNPALSEVTIKNNTADIGGGIYLSGTIATDFAYISGENMTISNNEADQYGGGIYSGYGNATLTNVTISDNSAALSGGGMYNTTNSVSYFRNVLIANSTSGDCVNVSGSGTVSYYSLVEDPINACGISNNVDGNRFGLDPFLGPLANNGGTTETHALLANSPAINTGTTGACPVTDQRGIARPQGSTCDIGSYEVEIISTTIKSVSTNDGWVLESSETSSTGGSMDSTASTIILGDNGADRQYRSILHFDTSSLPDNAIITSATIKLMEHSVSGTSPFTVLGSLYVDMRNPSFSLSALELGDFSTAAKKIKMGVFNPTPVSGWYSVRLSNGGRLYINRTGSTQIRLYFSIDDNDDLSADFIRFYSGNATAANRPKLLIQYYTP